VQRRRNNLALRGSGFHIRYVSGRLRPRSHKDRRGSALHGFAYWVEVEARVNGRRLVAFVPKGLANYDHARAGAGLPASESAPQVVNAHILYACAVSLDAEFLVLAGL